MPKSAKAHKPSGNGGVAQLGERQLCKLNVVGSIPSTSTTTTMNLTQGSGMKKLVLSVCAFMILFTSNAFGACTAEEFQKEVLAMQTTIAELAKDPDKLAKVNTEMESKFKDEMLEFAQFAQGAAGDPAKSQEMLDKGCALYGKMNTYLKSQQ